MGLQVGAACYEDAEAASHAVAALSSGTVVPAGASVYVVDAVGSPTGAVAFTLTDLTGAVSSSSYTQTPTYAPCGLLGAADGIAMGWGVIAVWIAAYALLVLRKGL